MEEVKKHSRQGMIGPSVLDCDKGFWSNEIEKVIKAGADYLHFDVMDGHFVPNISFGPSVINSLRKYFPHILFDCHFMTTEPEKWVKMLSDGAQGSEVEKLLLFTFHIEVTEPQNRTKEMIDFIRANKMRVGIALSPDTPVEMVMPYGDMVDLILVMTVYPGKGGQSFMGNMMSKVKALRNKFPDLDIEVDGGLNAKNIDEAAKAGANMIVSGSGVFKAEDISFAISTMKRSIQVHGNGLKLDDPEVYPLSYDKDREAKEDTNGHTDHSEAKKVKA